MVSSAKSPPVAIFRLTDCIVGYCTVGLGLFIHFWSFLSMGLSEALPTTAILTMSRSLHVDALACTTYPIIGVATYVAYVAARAGFEPTTFRSKGIDRIYQCATNAPQIKLNICIELLSFKKSGLVHRLV